MDNQERKNAIIRLKSEILHEKIIEELKKRGARVIKDFQLEIK